MASSKNLFSYSIRRFIFTSCVNNKSNASAIRQCKFMGKIMHGNTSKKKWHAGKINLPNKPFNPVAGKVINPQVKRRMVVLNKIFMEAITGIMATGEMSRDIVGRGVEISSVQISNDFSFLRVYWFTTEKDSHQQVLLSKLLDKCANRLRHEVMQMRVVGIVPPILFVKDKKQGLSFELDKLMLTADYGDDYVPTITPKSIKPELTLFSKLPADVREKVIEINKQEFNLDEDDVIDDAEQEELQDIFNVDLPPMRHDALGLDHYFIMSRIKQSLNKAQTAKNRKLNVDEIVEERRSFDPSTIKPLRTEEEAQAFSDFLLKRKIEEKRREKYELASLNTQIIDENSEDRDDENQYDDDYDSEDDDQDNFDDIDL
ncbi:hypothetical protein HCN44_006719 [Aphidius gifuensis]|uniref:Ribosome-binding factor A, mitochondrial n=1 Tax=Aphidius gifuensis TaxID=684658 RepID=A0A835CTQ4_APHGI|nr:putative ribosome-binding factor A, mitochondrial [Aphidius gifuensis]KAF7995612.1 hypothetical protein HCN44_006719 [Aphidius gifuensis]